MSYDLALPLIFVFSVGLPRSWPVPVSWVLKRDPGTAGHAGDLQRHQGGRRGLPPPPEPDDRDARRAPRGGHLPSLRLRARRTTTSTRSRPRCGWPSGPRSPSSSAPAARSSPGYVGMWISIRSNIRTASAARTSLNDALRIALRGGAVSGLFVVAMSLFGVGGLYWLVRQLHRGAARADPAAHRRIRLRRLLRGALRAAGRRHLHEGGRRRRRPRRQGRGRDPGRRPAQPGRHRGPRRRQRRRLRGPRRRPLRVHGRREHRRDDPRRDPRGLARASRTWPSRPASSASCSSPSSRAPSGFSPRSSGSFSCKHPRGRGPDAGPEPRLLRGRGARDRRLLRRDQVAPRQSRSSRRLVDVLPLRHDRRPDLDRLRLHHAVLHRIPVPPRPRDRRGVADRARPPTSSRASASASSAPCCRSSRSRSRSSPPTRSALAALPGGGLFGTAVATMGMLGTAAYILAMDTFGPITDNAGGIVEMSRQPEEIRKKTDRLDAVGNTTKALTKGYAIGSAALAAFLLFSAYLDELKNYGAELLLGQPRQARGLRGRPPRRDARVPLLRPRDQGRRQGGVRRHPGRPGPVPGASRHHEGHREARLRPHRGHRDARRAAPDDRCPVSWRSARRSPSA